MVPEAEAHSRLRLPAGDCGAGTDVSAIYVRPPGAAFVYVFAHGAGAGMEHSFMAGAAAALARHGVASLRFNFPYVEAGRRAPDRPPRLMATVRCAVREARRLAPDLPLFAGGKSMGGRMTSGAVAEESLAGVLGLVFAGFPLHPAGRPGTERGDHLAGVGLPMLFLQGGRDRLADPALLRSVLERIRPRPRLHVVDHADHGFHVPKRSGRSDDDVLEELAEVTASWMREVTGPPGRKA